MAGLALIPLLGWSLAVSLRTRCRAGSSLFLAASGIVVVCYAAALIGMLQAAAFALFWAGIGVLAWGAVRRRSEVLALVTAPPVVLLALLAATHAVLFQEARYFNYDEFYVWGPLARELVLSGALYDFQSAASRPSVPPALPLWQFWVCWNTAYSEPATYLAQFVLFLLPLLQLYDRLGWRQPVGVALVSALVIFLLATLTHGPATVLVDHVVGSLFAGVLLLHLRAPDRPGLLVVPLVVLSLAKETGTALALAAAAFVPAHRLLQLGVAWLRGSNPERRTWIAAATTGVLLLVPVLGAGSWMLRLSRLEGTPWVPSLWGLAGEEIDAFARSDWRDRDKLEARLWHAFLEQPMSRSLAAERFAEFRYELMPLYDEGFRLSTLGWLLASLGIAVLGAVLAPDLATRVSLGAAWLFFLALLAAYLASLLDAYDKSGHYGLQIPSYVRYVDTLLLPMVAVLVGGLLAVPREAPGEAATPTKAQLVALASILLALQAIERPHYRLLTRVRVGPPFARQVDEWATRFAGGLEAGQRLWIHHPLRARTSMDPWILRYRMTPVRVSVEGRRPDAEILRAALTKYEFVSFLSMTPAIRRELRRLGIHPDPEPEVVYRRRLEGDRFRLEPMPGG